MRILRKISLWLITMLYLGLVLGFVSKNYQGQLCNSVEVHISDSNQTGFLISEDIVGLLAEKKIDYLGVPLFQIDLDKIEKLILSNRIIEKCMAYTSIDGVLHIEINQREPFVRIIDSGGRGFYLDRDGNMLNLSKRFAPHVLVVNGNIRTAFATGQAVNINKLGNERWELRLKEIFELSKFIAGDTFWNAQVVQVYLNNSGEYELVPRIGPHIILLGSIDDYQEKFKKLEIFYKEGLSRVGWNQFIQINLKYKDQVVCTKI